MEVTRVGHGSSCEGVLKAGDLLETIDNKPIFSVPSLKAACRGKIVHSHRPRIIPNTAMPVFPLGAIFTFIALASSCYISLLFVVPLTCTRHSYILAGTPGTIVNLKFRDPAAPPSDLWQTVLLERERRLLPDGSGLHTV